MRNKNRDELLCDKLAQEYIINLKLLRHEYDEHLLQCMVGISHNLASNIVNHSVKQYTSGKKDQ
jgi:hypothetical protein